MPAGALPKWGCKSLPSAHGGMLLPGLYFVFGDMISWYLTPNKGDKLLPTVKGFTASSLFLLVKPAPSLVGSTLLAPVLLWVDFKEAGTKNKRETDGLVYLHICDTFDNPNDHATSTSCCFTTATSPAASADVHPCSHLGFAAGPCCLASRIQWRCGWVSMKKNPGLSLNEHIERKIYASQFSCGPMWWGQVVGSSSKCSFYCPCFNMQLRSMLKCSIQQKFEQSNQFSSVHR